MKQRPLHMTTYWPIDASKRRSSSDTNQKDDHESHRCYQCGEEGHYAAQCKTSRSQPPETETKWDKPKSGGMKCYNCHQRDTSRETCASALYCGEQLGGRDWKEVVVSNPDGSMKV